MSVVGASPAEVAGSKRTEINCHNCNKQFVAELDADIDGKYIIECAHCGHEHWREIKGGAVTEGRWGSGDTSVTRISGRSVWKSSVIQAKTSTVSHFLRERWLNRSDFNGV